MNFDDDDDSDFTFSPQSTNSKLASLFKSGTEENSDENLKYKASKQPQPVQQQQQQQPQSGAQQQAATSVIFFSGVQAFKFLNNKYEPQGKLGLAILSSPINNQAAYRILLYVNKTQPVCTIRITTELKISLQKNNYVTFYDDTRQVWSILFDSEDVVGNFATQLTLCKCNLLQGNLQGNDKLSQDLRFNDSDSNLIVEQNDSIEVTTLVSSWQNLKLNELENTIQKPFRLKLGKNKLPQVIENLVVNMKQGDRKLFVLNGNYFKSVYPNHSVIFYDIHIMRIKKNKEERSVSNVDIGEQMPPLPSLNINEQESRSRSESIKEKSKFINEQINDPKLEKAKVISRMAKLGQQMLPGSNNQTNIETQEEWDQNSTIDNMASSNFNTSLQQNILQQQQTQKIIQDAQAAKQALLLQNTLQQQLLQNQLAQAQAQTQQNQLALFKTPLNNTQLFNLIDPNAQQNILTQSTVQAQTVQNSQEISSNVVTKLDLITEKLDQIKQITNLNNQNMPNMETQVLLQNIQRIVKENEQYKKDLYDKSAKIEEQNGKITELLLKAQNYVEQSHQILELKNNSIQNTSEKSQNKILELEQDKMKLTTELTQLTSQISELNLEINRIKKEDLELRQQLNDVSKNTDQYKQNTDRLLVENADLQTKVDTVLAELKKERQLRKTHETKNQLNEEEINELKSSLVSSQKLLEEKKRKFESERLLFDQEMDELKKSNLSEVNQLKEKLLKARTNLNESQNEQIKQIEADLNREWQQKLEKLTQQNESKFERTIKELNEENSNLKVQINQMSESVKNVRLMNSKSENENEQLKHEIDELKVFKEKYERLQSQALVMKERYENRIKELLDAEPDTEIVAEEVKKLMNAMYKKIKSQIRADQFYSGNGILIAMLKIIKMITLQVLNSKSDEQEQEEEDVDYFSQHIYAPKVETVVKIVQETPVVVQEEIKEESHNKKVENTQEIIEEKKPVQLETTTIEDTPEVIEETKEDEEKNESKNVAQNVESSEDDDIQLIPEEEEKNEFFVNETLNETEILSDEKQNEEDVMQNSIDENIDVIPETEEKIDVKETLEIEEQEEEEEEQNVENEKENIEETETKMEENNKPEPMEEPKIEVKKNQVTKGLFDDEEDDDELFSLTSKSKNDSKLFETESDLPKADLKTEENKTNETASQNLTSTNPPANFKFSPPPLFDDEEENSEQDIDWFK